MLLAARRVMRPASAVRLATRGLSTSRVALGSRPAWSQVDAEELSAASSYEMENYVAGTWTKAASTIPIVDPMNGEVFLQCPDTQPSELGPFIDAMRAVPKSGLHNPYKNPERYVEWGRVTAAAAAELSKEPVKRHFARLIQRVAPKSWPQALGEVEVTLAFLRNFTGDQVRFLARSFGSPGDHAGQMPTGHRWPYGPVALIAPFNFPLEIAALQVMGAFYMGNRPTVHVDAKVSVVMEEFFRLLLACGAPPGSFDLLHGRGTTMNELLLRGEPRSTLFTGSQKVAEHLAEQLKGKVYLEDAGFDWKVLGPDVADLDHVAWQCDQDAYASTGQKCSAQSCLFAHENWVAAGLLDRLGDLAARRSLDDLTVGPVLTWSTDRILAHVDRLLALPGARLLFGGKPLEGHSIPAVYGAVEPTAVHVPLASALASPEAFAAFSTELFGPFQVVTTYSTDELPLVLEAIERMHAHLTAAVVSKDPQFINTVLGNTVNGTTYAGIRARTTGAPQNHWFGPAGDPRAAGIGTPEAIKLVWSTHREIIYDVGPAADPAKLVQS